MPIKNFTNFLDWVALGGEIFQKLKFLVVGDHFEPMFKIADSYLECLNPKL